MEGGGGEGEGEGYTLVARKPAFGLPTGCPVCLPVYAYLKLARFPFRLDFNSTYPDSDEIPYVESGTYVAFNNEHGGVIQYLKEDGIVDLDSEFNSVPEWVSFKAMISTWLEDAITYELWIGCDGNSAWNIYYSDLPWVIGKLLNLNQVYSVKKRLGLTRENTERIEKEIYQKAKSAYGALSVKLGEEMFVFENRPSSLDALLLAHVLFTLEALPDASVLRTSLLEFSNLVRYAERLKTEFLDVGSPSAPLLHPSSSTSSRNSSSSSSKPKRKPKKEKTAEEKTFRRRAKYFLATQVVAVLLFLSIMGGYNISEVEDDDDEGYD